MKVPATYPDVERVTRDLLEALVAPTEPTVTVGVGVPTDWTPSSAAHLQVSCDGTPTLEHPVVAHATVRVTAWAATTSEAKRLANAALGFLAAHRGSTDIAVILPLTGVFPARDALTHAELASVTLRVTVRSTPL